MPQNLATPNDQTSPAEQVTAWLSAQSADVISHRAIHQRFRSQAWAATSTRLDRVMALLERDGHVSRGRRHAGLHGGRPSTVWVIHPSLRASSVRVDRNTGAASVLATATLALRDHLNDEQYLRALPHLDALLAIVTDASAPRAVA